MKGMKKPLALLLALVMAFSLLSVGAWADEEEAPAEEAAFIDLGGEEAIPETPAEEPAEAPEEELAPAEEPAEAPEEEAAPAEEPAEAPEDEAVLLDGETADEGGAAESATEKVAKVGETEYATLQEAVDAVGTSGGTVTLLQDAQGDGIKFAEGSKVTIDFNGHTYTVLNTVGSTGTETNGFQLLKTSVITLKNGSLYSPKAIILLQNYSNLTLEDMNLDMSEASQVTYVASNNFGSLTVKGNTVIKAAPGQCAFDLWYGMYPVYDEGVTVTFGEDFTGTVQGKVEYGRKNRAANMDWMSKTKLDINSPKAMFDVTFASGHGGDIPENPNINISGGTFTTKNAVRGDFLAPGYGIDGTGKVYQTVSAVEFTPAGENQIAQSLVKFPTTLESGTYKLLTDVTVAEPVYLKGDGADVTIDMGGFTLTSTVSGKDSRGFYLDTVSGGIKKATVTIKNGTFSLPEAPRAFQFNKETSNVSLTIGDNAVINLPSAPGDYSVASVWGASNSVTLAESATVNAASSYGITLFGGAADKNSLTINGTIKAVTPIGTNGSNTLSGTITVGGKAVLESTGNDHAMYLPGKVTVTIENGAKLSGGDAIYIKSGTLTIKGGEFTATSERKLYEYYGNGGRLTGDVIVVDNCSYPGGAPTVSIEGGTFTSKYGSAVGSYAYNKTDGVDNKPVIGFIKDGTFKTEAVGVPVFTTDGKHESVEVADNLVVSGKRIGGDGKIVEATATLTTNTPAATDEQTTTYTATTTGASSFTIEVKSGTGTVTPSESATFTPPTDTTANVANEKVELDAINMTTFLSDMIDSKVKDDNDTEVTLNQNNSDSVSFAMSAKAPADVNNTATSFTLEIHPAVKVGDKEFALPNGYIAKPMKVTLPGLIKGAKLLRILHTLADGTQESVKFEQNIGSGDVSFESASFSKFTFVNEPVASDNKTSELEMYTITGVADGNGGYNKQVDLADFTTTAEVKIMVKAGEKISTLSAYDITVTLPKGLSYVDNSSDLTLNSKNTNAEGITTVRFLNAAENTGGTYYQFNANEEKEFGSFKVNATIDAVYQETLAVKVTAATVGKTKVDNYEYTPFLPNTNAPEGGTTTTPATFQLTKTWTVTFAQLNKKVDASTSEKTYSTANLTVGHNKPMDFTDTSFTAEEKAYFDATELAKETPGLLPIAAGYQFDKWKEKEGALATTVTGDLTYTAEWKTVDYKITYADESVSTKVGTWSKAQETYNIETNLNIANPEKTAYTFAKWGVALTSNGKELGPKWDTTNGMTSVSGYGFYGDVTLTANWTPIEYTVTFKEEAGIVGKVDYTKMKVSNRGTDLKATKADGATNYTMSYTIETGIPVTITLTGYDFNGWKVKTDGVTGSSYVKDAVMEAITSSVDAATPANTKLYYGNVTLESQWSVKLKFAFANFRYAYDEDSLMLVEWDGAAGGQLNFKDGTEIKALFKTTEQKYIDAYKTVMSLGDSDTLPTQVYVTIVTKATKGDKGKNDADLKDLFLIKDKDGNTPLSNEEIKFTGDVAGQNTTMLDNKITLADLSNASDLFADTKWFGYNQIGIKNRLNADADKSAEGTIGDLAEIILNQGLSVDEVLAKTSSSGS